MFTLLLSWRNLWRNPRRTFITFLMEVIASACVILTLGFMRGMLVQMEYYATHMGQGAIQISSESYRDDYRLQDTLPETWRPWGGDLPSAPRLYSFGLGSSGEHSTGVALWGVDPDIERTVSHFHKHIKQGSFLSSKDPTGVVIGHLLAERLGEKVGDEFIVVTQAADGSLGNDIFRIRGILRPIGAALDGSIVLMPLVTAQTLVALPKRLHEWVFVLPEGAHGAKDLAAWVTRLESRTAARPFAKGEATKVWTWRQLNPTLAMMIDISSSFTWIFVAIVFLSASFGILNTLLMAIFERRHEFGVLLGLGWSPKRLVGSVLYEALWIAVAGGLVGISIGGAYSSYLERVGWDISSFSKEINISGIAMSTVLRTLTEPGDYVGTMLFLCVTTLLCAIYPIIQVVRLDPVEALR